MEFDVKKYASMSPFEIKKELYNLANKSCFEKNKKSGNEQVLNTVLNAGRGNPNFLNVTVREAFGFLNLFAVKHTTAFSQYTDIGLRPQMHALYHQFKKFIKDCPQELGVAFLKKAIDFAVLTYHLNPNEFLYELIDAVLGDYYPQPPRILPRVEIITRKYLEKILCYDHKLPKGRFDLFATEGATGAMIYIFNSLKRNKIIKEKDHIAIITPIFSPYLEIPHLKEFNLVEILVEGSQDKDWQILDRELDKLNNPKIKALYIVNPTNPTSVAINKETIKKITKIVNTKRKDLIIIADTVYATFVEEFHSLIKYIPYNTLCVYSFSKYFGATGWRLGVIMLNEKNVIDDKLAKLAKQDKADLRNAYNTVSLDTDSIAFIDRMVIDSRESALAHTAGLSCPQQAIMMLFCLFELIDDKQVYKKDIHKILKQRIGDLYANLELRTPQEKGHTYYYALIDILGLAEKRHGKAFGQYLKKSIDPLEFIFRLAREHSIVCLPGEGFAGPKWSLRVSVANLNDDKYPIIGSRIVLLIDDYHYEWKNPSKK